MKIFTKRTTLALLAMAVMALVGCKNEVALTYPAISGHRGANVIAPENTMASIDSCIKYGIEFAEVDLVISKDSVFYILHDSTLNRTTNGEGNIANWMSADIDTLDAGSWFGEEFAGQRVPRFQQVLRRAKEGGVKIAIDYRQGDLAKLVELVEAEGMIENCTYIFNEEKILEFRSIAPHIPMIQGYVNGAEDYPAVAASEAKPDIAVIFMDRLTLELSREMKADGLKVLVLALGVDSDAEADFKRAAELEADIVATDLPEVMARMRNN